MGYIGERNYEKYSEPVPSTKIRPVVNSKVTLAGILKPSTTDSLMYECDILNLTPDSYKEILNEKQIDLFLCDSLCPEGEEELYGCMVEILNLCRERKIPSLYWDTDENGCREPDFELLKQFDGVFTLDPSRIDHYKQALMKDVFCLPLAVQPRVHNPVERNIINKEATIHNNPYLEVKRIMGTANRLYLMNFLKNAGDLGFVPKEVYQLLAVGAPLISPWHRAFDELYPQTIKPFRTHEEYTGIIAPLLKDRDKVDKISVLAQRYALSSGTYTNRMDTLLKKAGRMDKATKQPRVTMVSSTNKIDAMENIFKNYENQDYLNKELIIVLNNNKLDLGEWKSKASEYRNVQVFRLDESQPLGRCLNLAIDNTDSSFISKCDDDNYYGESFLSDLMNAFKYADSEIVGKLTYYCYLEGCRILALMCPQMEYRYVNMLSGSALIIKREVFDKVRFSDKRAGSDTVFLKECIREGVRMFSADRFNYVYKRHPTMETHTWKMPDEVFLRSCKVIDITDHYVDQVTI